MIPTWVKTLGAILDHEKPLQVIARCQKCGHDIPVDVPALAAKVGRDYSLVNRRSRCRVPGCTGWVGFKYSTGTWFYPMWDEATDWRWMTMKN